MRQDTMIMGIISPWDMNPEQFLEIVEDREAWQRYNHGSHMCKADMISD